MLNDIRVSGKDSDVSMAYQENGMCGHDTCMSALLPAQKRRGSNIKYGLSPVDCMRGVTMDQEEMIKLLAKDVVWAVDPVESEAFDKLAERYLEDPAPMARPNGGKGGAGSAGIGEWMEVVTPGAMAAAAGVISYLIHHVLLPKLPGRARGSVEIPFSPCGSTGYEQCLQKIRKDLPQSLYEVFDIYELRLIETVCEARLYGETQETYAMRYRLISQINQLTRDAGLSRNFH